MAPQKHKAEFNTKTGNMKPLVPKRNSVEFDAVEFMHFLEETDWTDEEKAEYIALVWNIICEFVALGFGVHPIQKAQEDCGKRTPSSMQSPLAAAAVVNSSHSNLIEKFVRLSGVEPLSDGEGVSDG
ncbi:hypothetical protein [Thalassospira alkalitolerans]|uniref:Uncharacterized protein n=1 Tax=Thalassospira alkalitolerans TaxID=1293890 RepID=A0A1Y2L9D0_9PROT|nr:hypothetical protein [Thalassospira alkalitolerans]OSQ47045.1 hypothetical protein TALK_13525 [Thalassospira alkalitolerans]